MFSDDEIRRLRALCEAATPGPWTAQTVCDTDSDDWCAVGPTHLYADDDPAVDDGDPHPAAEADAAFIAAARTALPECLDEVEGLGRLLGQRRIWKCQTHADAAKSGWGCPCCVFELRTENEDLRAQLAAIKPSVDRQTAEWKAQLDAVARERDAARSAADRPFERLREMGFQVREERDKSTADESRIREIADEVLGLQPVDVPVADLLDGIERAYHAERRVKINVMQELEKAHTEVTLLRMHLLPQQLGFRCPTCATAWTSMEAAGFQAIGVDGVFGPLTCNGCPGRNRDQLALDLAGTESGRTTSHDDALPVTPSHSISNQPLGEPEQ